jgi:hypothetical protein
MQSPGTEGDLARSRLGIVKKIGQLSPPIMEDLNKALKLHYDLE